MPFGLILILFLILFLFLTAENTELAESFSLGDIFYEKRKYVAKRIFHDLAPLPLTTRHALSVLRNL